MVQNSKIKFIILILWILIFKNINVNCQQVNLTLVFPLKKGIICGRIMIPETISSEEKEEIDLIPLENVKVTVTDSEGITHVVFTDENGFYQFKEIAPGCYYIIIATIKLNEKEIIYKDIVEKVISGETYYAGIADLQSTVTASIIENLQKNGLFDILGEMIAPYCLP